MACGGLGCRVENVVVGHRVVVSENLLARAPLGQGSKDAARFLAKFDPLHIRLNLSVRVSMS